MSLKYITVEALLLAHSKLSRVFAVISLIARHFKKFSSGLKKPFSLSIQISYTAFVYHSYLSAKKSVNPEEILLIHLPEILNHKLERAV